MGRIFGTDGVRGVANADLTIELAMDIGRAAAMVVEESIGRKPLFLVGMDTRLSGHMLESAMTAGLCSAGADVLQLGVVPTPAVAYLVTKYGADAGIMLSASHNPYEYNGIKIFNGSGYKLLDSQEEEMEEIVLDHLRPYSVKTPHELGHVRRADNAAADYVSYLASTVSEDLSGLRVAVDCANGSAGRTAAMLFERLGVKADIFHADDDGVNINLDCGSTHMGFLQRLVPEKGYDLGLAFDGDADRCLAVDEKGALIDGDQMMAIFAYHMKAKGRLKNNMLVATVMSNLGLFKFGEENGVGVLSAKVGDRYVLEMMLAEDARIGGEQSGHIIFRDFMTTGDGQLSAIQLLALLAHDKAALSQAAGLMRVYPQVLVNVEATPEMKQALETDARVREEIARQEQRLGTEGRVLVRPSGTEPLIRVMVEGPEQGMIDEIARTIAAAIEPRVPAVV